MRRSGARVAWAALLVVVLVQFAVVVLRYVFGARLDLADRDDHLRPRRAVHAGRGLDACARAAMCGSTCSMPTPAPRRRALIDLCGALLLLLPFMLVLLWFALPYVARSWAILERSRETSGLPLVFLLKTLIPLFAVLMALQGVAQAIRALAARCCPAAERRRAPMMRSRRTPRHPDGRRGLRPAVRRLSGGAHARRRVARLRRARPPRRRDGLLASSARCRSASSA